MWYTYIHYREIDLKPFYVGKGTGRRAHSKANRNMHWHRTVAKHGIVVEVCSKWSSESDAFDHEKLLILCLRGLGFRLCNLTDGGDGPSGMRHSREARMKMSAAQKGRPKSDAHKQALKDAAARSTHVRPLGTTHSEATKKKLSEIKKATGTPWLVGKPGHGRKKTTCVTYGIVFESSLWAVQWLREGGFLTACRTSMRDYSKKGKEYCGLMWKVG